MSEQVYKIPLQNTPQRFEVTLAGRDFILVCRWFSGPALWVISLYDAGSLAVLMLNMPIVTGADLLRQFAYLGIPGAFISFTQGDEDTPATLENLGADANLYHVVDPDAVEASSRFIGYIP